MRGAQRSLQSPLLAPHADRTLAEHETDRVRSLGIPSIKGF
jgi:hypothetical protein